MRPMDVETVNHNTIISNQLISNASEQRPSHNLADLGKILKKRNEKLEGVFDHRRRPDLS